MEIQAMQGLSENPSIDSNNTNALFQEILMDVLSNNSLNTNSMQSIGYLWSSLSNSPSSQFTATPSTLSNPMTDNTSSTHTKTNFDQIISKAAALYNVPEKLIQSVIKQESGFNPNAQSYAGAGGLMQLMPATAKSLGVQDIFNPMENVMGGSKYLSQLLSRYNGNIEMALAAYNAGPGNVDKYGGIPPFKETQNYVSNIMNSYLA